MANRLAELPGLARACAALATGAAVVVPNPPPMTYGIVATAARRVNAVKRRPLDQNVAVSLHDRGEWAALTAAIDLADGCLSGVNVLLQQRLSVLLPLRQDVAAPDWTAPAVRNGYLAAFNAHWAPTAPLWERFPRPYGSSANVTGQDPANSAERPTTMFGGSCFDVEGDLLEGRPRQRSASTMVRIDPDGRLVLHRDSAQNAGSSRSEFLSGLADETGLGSAIERPS